MKRLQKMLLLVMLFVCMGMAAAETYGEAVERLCVEVNKINRTIDGFSSMFVWIIIIGVVITIVFIVLISSHGTDIAQSMARIRDLRPEVAANTELCTKIEALTQQNKDLINRHEELIKLLLSRMGTQAPQQNVIVQQPKALTRPTQPIVEINPQSQEDQSWLAAQRKKRTQSQ